MSADDLPSHIIKRKNSVGKQDFEKNYLQRLHIHTIYSIYPVSTSICYKLIMREEIAF